MKLVLFDIDGTLLWTDGAGRRAMEGALVDVYGVPGDPAYRYDGKTDRQIAREQLRAAGLDDGAIDARLPALLDRYVDRLGDELAGAVAQPFAGVVPLLDALEARRDAATLGLLTGNIEPGARAKLRAVGLAFERFLVNAFGSDREHRPELPPVAQRRARDLLGLDVPGERVVIIGDTPADIHCGRPIGARAIAVATGRYDADALAAHAPAAVFPTLTDTDAVLAAILD
jgi:phosphoglycolate phosphatase-like HAD superfamily hydrolase